jgi:uncharacterized repeat protein (TIGR01451 family)
MRIARVFTALAFTLLLASPALAGEPLADLSVTKTDTTDPLLGTAPVEVEYTIVVQNLGPTDASGVVVTDTFPAVPDGIGASSPLDWDLAFLPGFTGAIFTKVNPLTVADGPQVLTLNLTYDNPIADGTILTNVVTVDSSTPDPNAANNTDTETTTIGPPPTQSQPAASLPNAATAPPATGSPLATLGFAALLIGTLGVLVVANARGVARRR